MINFSVLVLYIFSIIVFLAVPGPITLLVASKGLKYGMQASVKTVTGTNIASLILIAVSFSIIQGLFAVSENLLSWLSLIGGLYLIYLAIGFIREPVHLKDQVITDKKIDSHFKHGFILGISSPKDVIFFIAFFPSFFAVSDNPLVAIVVLTIIWVICDFVVLLLYAFVFSKLINDNIAGVVAKVSGAILLLIAIYALYRGLSTLL